MSQIKLLLDIISDVRSLGDSLQAYADALTAWVLARRSQHLQLSTI